VQDIINSILQPASVADTITKLSATTFAQPIEVKMLAVMVPLLVKGLRERNTAIKRKTIVIITNMVKLVEEPAHLAAFMPKLLPLVDKARFVPQGRAQQRSARVGSAGIACADSACVCTRALRLVVNSSALHVT
jgi:ACR3 family arsenite efflux pump ArsB